MIKGPVIEIGGSLILGVIIGEFLCFLRKGQRRDELQMISLQLELQQVYQPVRIFIPINLYSNGFMLVNMYKKSKRVFDSVDAFSAQFIHYSYFAGASLDLSILKTEDLWE